MSTSSPAGIQALCGSLLAICTIIVALRFYARRSQHTYIGIDDWFILPAYITFVGMVACALYGVHLRYFGSTDAQVAAAKLKFATEASLVVSLDILSAACSGFTRISALLFFRRIFWVPGRTKGLLAGLYILIAIVTLWMAAFIILPPLQCGPDLSVWNAKPAVRAKHCGKLGNHIILGFCISDLILETLIIGIPVPLVLRLHASLRRRLAVLFVFLTAFVSLGAVVARLVITTQILQKTVTDKSASNTTQTFMWVLEAGFALIAVNLPSLWWLRTKVQTEKVLNSMRSAMSLHSRSNHSSKHSDNRTAAGIEGDVEEGSTKASDEITLKGEREKPVMDHKDSGNSENYLVGPPWTE